MAHPAFLDGRIDTGFINKHYTAAHAVQENPQETLAAALAAALLVNGQHEPVASGSNGQAEPMSNWKRLRQETFR
jgi:acetyl/propionyl-CoA carboxylase alpha subunit